MLTAEMTQMVAGSRSMNMYTFISDSIPDGPANWICKYQPTGSPFSVIGWQFRHPNPSSDKAYGLWSVQFFNTHGSPTFIRKFHFEIERDSPDSGIWVPSTEVFFVQMEQGTLEEPLSEDQDGKLIIRVHMHLKDTTMVVQEAVTFEVSIPSGVDLELNECKAAEVTSIAGDVGKVTSPHFYVGSEADGGCTPESNWYRHELGTCKGYYEFASCNEENDDGKLGIIQYALPGCEGTEFPKTSKNHGSIKESCICCEMGIGACMTTRISVRGHHNTIGREDAFGDSNALYVVLYCIAGVMFLLGIAGFILWMYKKYRKRSQSRRRSADENGGRVYVNANNEEQDEKRDDLDGPDDQGAANEVFHI